MTRPCNRENMTKFVKALFSGEYEQGTGTLNLGGKFCCLGVACDVALKDGLELTVETVGGKKCFCGAIHVASDGRKSYDGEQSVLPQSVADWLGLEEVRNEADYLVSGRTNPVLAGRSATSWNDTMGASFPIIGQLFFHEYLEESDVQFIEIA